jgi:hypothetical protein
MMWVKVWRSAGTPMVGGGNSGSCVGSLVIGTSEHRETSLPSPAKTLERMLGISITITHSFRPYRRVS